MHFDIRPTVWITHFNSIQKFFYCRVVLKYLYFCFWRLKNREIFLQFSSFFSLLFFPCHLSEEFCSTLHFRFLFVQTFSLVTFSTLSLFSVFASVFIYVYLVIFYIFVSLFSVFLSTLRHFYLSFWITFPFSFLCFSVFLSTFKTFLHLCLCLFIFLFCLCFGFFMFLSTFKNFLLLYYPCLHTFYLSVSVFLCFCQLLRHFRFSQNWRWWYSHTEQKF